MQVKKNLVSIKMFLLALKQIKLPGRSERDGMPLIQAKRY